MYLVCRRRIGSIEVEVALDLTRQQIPIRLRDYGNVDYGVRLRALLVGTETTDPVLTVSVSKHDE